MPEADAGVPGRASVASKSKAAFPDRNTTALYLGSSPEDLLTSTRYVPVELKTAPEDVLRVIAAVPLAAFVLPLAEGVIAVASLHASALFSALLEYGNRLTSYSVPDSALVSVRTPSLPGVVSSPVSYSELVSDITTTWQTVKTAAAHNIHTKNIPAFITALILTLFNIYK
jgi:hypothetical protein